MLHLRRPAGERLRCRERGRDQQQQQADDATLHDILQQTARAAFLEELGASRTAALDLSQGSFAGYRHSNARSRWVLHAVPGPRLLPHTLRAGRSRARAGLRAGQRADAVRRTVGRLPRRAGGARNSASPRSTCSGQGASDKPALFISQDDQVAALALLIDQLGDGPVFLSGISFGGLIALRYAIEHGNRLAGLVLDEHFRGALAATAAARQRAAQRPDPRRDQLPAGPATADEPVRCMAWSRSSATSKRSSGRAGSPTIVYALQNLMESFLDFQTADAAAFGDRHPDDDPERRVRLSHPRALHETLRLQIPDSALVIIPRAFHAFTLEKPALTADLLSALPRMFSPGTWKGDRSVWIAPENAGDPLIPFRPATTICAPFRRTGCRHGACSLGPLDATGRVPPRQQTRVAAFLVSGHGAMARQLAIALAWQMNASLADAN